MRGGGFIEGRRPHCSDVLWYEVGEHAKASGGHVWRRAGYVQGADDYQTELEVEGERSLRRRSKEKRKTDVG